MTGVQILRDYLYLDVDKVKSIAGQLERGVPEETKLTERESTKKSVGYGPIASYNPERGEEFATSRSMLDSLFPELEDALESDGWLVDISDIFHQTQSSPFDEIRSIRPEASLFRITASGYLFDSRYLAGIMAGFSSTVAGIQDLERAQESDQNPSNKGNKQGGRKPPNVNRKPRDAGTGNLEDSIEDFANTFDISADFLRAIVRTSRGMYKPGLNLVLASSDETGALTVTARLQENRRYLDTDPEIAGSRFGVGSQQWTLIGTVGHYSTGPGEDELEKILRAVARSTEQRFDRTGFMRDINDVIERVGRAGMIDLPQHPGFSAIPIAVYRTSVRHQIHVPGVRGTV